MKYVTGVQALNIPCELETTGDWHRSAIRWTELCLRDSDTMFFGEYGIESEKTVPEHEGKYYVANHIRALLDLLQEGDFSNAQGMRKDYIGNDNYNAEVFRQVKKLSVLVNWPQIDDFMTREYKVSWLLFKSTGEALGANGKPIDRSYLERDLPETIRTAIRGLTRSFGNSEAGTMFSRDDLQKAIDSAYTGNKITEEQLEYLKRKYL